MQRACLRHAGLWNRRGVPDLDSDEAIVTEPQVRFVRIPFPAQRAASVVSLVGAPQDPASSDPSSEAPNASESDPVQDELERRHVSLDCGRGVVLMPIRIHNNARREIGRISSCRRGPTLPGQPSAFYGPLGVQDRRPDDVSILDGVCSRCSQRSSCGRCENQAQRSEAAAG